MRLDYAQSAEEARKAKVQLQLKSGVVEV